MKKEKYKLIKDYPQSPVLGYIADFTITDILYNAGTADTDLIEGDCKNFPELWVKYKFTTEDGVDIFEGDNYYEDNRAGILKLHASDREYPKNYQVFSTKKAAQKYLASLVPTLESCNEDTTIKELIPKGQKSSEVHTGSGKVIIGQDKIVCDSTITLAFKKKTELEEGVWYKMVGNKIWLIYSKELNMSGFVNTFWQTNIQLGSQDHLEKANIEEVKELLLRKAKKDYPEGTKFDQSTAYGGVGPKEIIVCNCYIEDSGIPGEFNITAGGYGVFGADNIWAEIIEKPLCQDKKGKFWYESDFKNEGIYQITTNTTVWLSRIYTPLIKYTRDNFKLISLLHPEDNSFYSSPGSQDCSEIKDIREATLTQKDWLERCEKAGKFVPLNLAQYGVRWNTWETIDVNVDNEFEDWEWFDTRKERDIYVKMNKPMFSKQQIIDLLDSIGEHG